MLGNEFFQSNLVHGEIKTAVGEIRDISMTALRDIYNFRRKK